MAWLETFTSPLAHFKAPPTRARGRRGGATCVWTLLVRLKALFTDGAKATAHFTVFRCDPSPQMQRVHLSKAASENADAAAVEEKVLDFQLGEYER